MNLNIGTLMPNDMKIHIALKVCDLKSMSFTDNTQLCCHRDIIVSQAHPDAVEMKGRNWFLQTFQYE